MSREVMTRRLLVLFTPAVLLTPAPAAPVPEHLFLTEPLYFPATVGTERVYCRGEDEWTEVVTRVETCGRTVMVAVGRKRDGSVIPLEAVQVSAGNLARVSVVGRPLAPSLELLRAPLTPGRRWRR